MSPASARRSRTSTRWSAWCRCARRKTRRAACRRPTSSATSRIARTRVAAATSRPRIASARNCSTSGSSSRTHPRARAGSESRGPMDAPNLKTPLPGPKAKALIERDGKVVSPSYTRDYPFVIARGEGATVEDVDGNVFLDCAAGIAVNSTGVSHPDVVRAIADQAGKFIHMTGTDFYYEPQVRLAETLEPIAP